jgi:beta-galactosidase
VGRGKLGPAKQKWAWISRLEVVTLNAARNLRFYFLFILVNVLVALCPAYANDNIFPSAPAASNAINFDGKGFIINGHRTFIASGGMEYARVPRALWRDRLLQMKRAGFNCTETYVFWNFHEPKENQWNFEGGHDLNAYLKLVHEVGMYAIVRIGPYVCAEWDSGGYPVWLRFKPGVSVRQDNQPFLDETFKYYDKVVPIVAANQINHGGSVILVQIENEYDGGWGTDSNPYEQKLRQKVLDLGIEVPTFFSGLHHGSDPAGSTPWDDATRQSPWFTTEFWSTWYNDYGAQDPDFTTRGTWKILAFGGNGYNYYMAHGGTNFDWYNNDEDASSYDYGSAIGEAGDLRPLYYKFKEAAMFAHTFQSILENSVSSTAEHHSISTSGAFKEYARSGPAGTVIFLDNPSKQDTSAQISGLDNPSEPSSGPAIIEEQKMLPVIENFAVTPAITIDQSVTQILSSVTNGNNTSMIVYGPTGSGGSIELSAKSGLSLVDGPNWSSTDANHGALEFAYPSRGVQSTIIKSGSDRLRILVMNEELADRSWLIESTEGTDIVTGPDYIGAATVIPGHKIFHAEFKSPKFVDATDFTPDLKQATMHPDTATGPLPAAPALTAWEEKTVDETSPSFDDAHWLTSDQPQCMGADGDYSAYCWYRTTVQSASDGIKYLVPTTIRDRMVVFVDGHRVPDSSITDRYAALHLTSGQHNVAILAVHYGRNKLYAYSGPIDKIDAKGIGGPVTLSNSLGDSLTSWQCMLSPTADKPSGGPPAVGDARWHPVKLGTDVFNQSNGWAWFQTTVPASANGEVPTSVTVHFDSVDDNAEVYCNGSLAGTHQGWNSGFSVDMKPWWLPGKPNVIAILDQNTGGGGGINGTVTLAANTSSSTVSGWKMRGGVGDPTVISDWRPVSPFPDPAPPTFFRAEFNGPEPTDIGPYPIFRVRPTGMSAGFVWLNGHNLGRYPAKSPVDGIYLPECWILSGENILSIFDEDGESPKDVTLTTETAASRYECTYSF